VAHFSGSDARFASPIARWVPFFSATPRLVLPPVRSYSLHSHRRRFFGDICRQYRVISRMCNEEALLALGTMSVALSGRHVLWKRRPLRAAPRWCPCGGVGFHGESVKRQDVFFLTYIFFFARRISSSPVTPVGEPKGWIQPLGPYSGAFQFECPISHPLLPFLRARFLLLWTFKLVNDGLSRNPRATRKASLCWTKEQETHTPSVGDRKHCFEDQGDVKS
jgi:hypothetical protein